MIISPLTRAIGSGTQWHSFETTRILFRASPSDSPTLPCRVKSPWGGMILSSRSQMRKVCTRVSRRAISMSWIVDTSPGRTQRGNTGSWLASSFRAATRSCDLAQTQRFDFPKSPYKGRKTMKTAKQLLQAYIDGSAQESAALFAENGALELANLADLGVEP